MGIQLKNNASGTLATAINASDTGIVLTTGNGASFPSLGASDYFYATLESTGGTLEVIKVTVRSGDSMTVVRAQEGTSAQSFAAGSRVELRVTGAAVTDFSQAGAGAVIRNFRDKLQDIVSVIDFGADPTGSLDSTTAIQDALNAAKHVTFGDASDVYKVTATLNLQDGQVLDFNRATVRMYTAQTRMFNAVGCENVIIRNGVLIGYKTDFVNSPSSLAVCISLGTDSNNMIVENNKFFDFAYSPVSTVNYGKVFNFTFKNNRVTGPGATVLDNINKRNCTGITIDGLFISIEGNQISDTAQGLTVAAESENISIANNIIFDIINEHGMYIDAGCQNVAVVGNVVYNTDAVGIKFQWNDSFTTQEPSNLVIANNTLFECGLANGGDGISVLSTTAAPVTKKLNGCTITGNVVRLVGQDAILVRYVRNLTIGNNTILTAARYGIACTDTDAAVIDGNNISSTQFNGIYHDNTGNNVSITNNVLTAPGLSGDNTNGNSSGILFAGGTGVGRNIAGNYVYGDEVKTQYALFYSGGDQLKTRISGNTFLNTNDYAIRLKSPTEALAYFGENRLLNYAGSREVSGLSTDLTQGSLLTFFAAAAPTTGYWPLGYIVFNATPSAGGTIGWVCTSAGTPGVWKTFGAISA